jgi:hypothetical protein
VLIRECRPISKTKHHVLVKIVKARKYVPFVPPSNESFTISRVGRPPRTQSAGVTDTDEQIKSLTSFEPKKTVERQVERSHYLGNMRSAQTKGLSLPQSWLDNWSDAHWNFLRRRDTGRPMDLGVTGWRANWRNHGKESWDFKEAGLFPANSHLTFEPPVELLRTLHDIRLQIYAPQTDREASLFVDSFRTPREPQTPFVSVIWPHSNSAPEVWTGARRFALLLTELRLSQVQAEYLWNDADDPVEGVAFPSDLPTTTNDCKNLSGVFLRMGEFEYEAQIGSPGLGDLHAGVVWPATARPEKQFLREISLFILSGGDRRLKNLTVDQLSNMLMRCTVHLMGART